MHPLVEVMHGLACDSEWVVKPRWIDHVSSVHTISDLSTGGILSLYTSEAQDTHHDADGFFRCLDRCSP